ncbi:hypothetical protein GCM10007301_10770 [Azorhizobium oxalatiphilum]|uniref:Uncharacterized protein n=1 Tax=Azorhizobium oxalatiphilum TaxID=980631 RepID=A0A917BST6_9HYPH|nr:hypothetical protein [Azorhizobium oxalatiphilum]GGF53155.1 hypothetical protein GCM10007301_10770 [Azorhizobium oxalatiphilum]
MIISARMIGLDDLAARLEARLNEAPIAAVLDRMADRLATAAIARGGTGVEVETAPGRREVGSADPAAVAREIGGPHTPAAPWLMPALAAVRSGEGA